jgi:hypothetical protein
MIAPLRILLPGDHPALGQSLKRTLTARFHPVEFDEGKSGLESLDPALVPVQLEMEKAFSG